MGTITEKLKRLAQTKADIRAAIIRMGQPVADSESFSSYADKIIAIKTGVDTSDGTVSAGDILSGKVAYAGGKRIEGTIPVMGEESLSASGATVTVPAGYYPTAASRAVDTVQRAVPQIIMADSSKGIVRATVNQEAGYVVAGNAISSDLYLRTQAAATITPGTVAQTAVAAERYTTGNVVVNGDANLKAENIKSGVNIFGVAGRYAGRTVRGYSLDNATLSDPDSSGNVVVSGLNIGGGEVIAVSAGIHAYYSMMNQTYMFEFSYIQKDGVSFHSYFGNEKAGMADCSLPRAFNSGGILKLNLGSMARSFSNLSIAAKTGTNIKSGVLVLE